MSCVIMVMQPWLLKNVFHSASLHQALAGAAPRLSTRGMSVLPRHTTKQTFFWLLKKGVLIQNRCVRSFTGCFKSSRVYCVSCSKFAVMIFSSQSVISRVYTEFTFTFMHLADTFIQSDLTCIQVTVSTFYQLLLSLGIEPMILALLAPCSTSWATGKLGNNHQSYDLVMVWFAWNLSRVRFWQHFDSLSNFEYCVYVYIYVNCVYTWCFFVSNCLSNFINYIWLNVIQVFQR